MSFFGTFALVANRGDIILKLFVDCMSGVLKNILLPFYFSRSPLFLLPQWLLIQFPGKTKVEFKSDLYFKLPFMLIELGLKKTISWKCHSAEEIPLQGVFPPWDYLHVLSLGSQEDSTS